MKVIVMAGGFGTRLYPLTVNCPKAMVPLVNKPVLAHLISLLRRHHFSEVIITARRSADLIQNYFGDGRRFGLHITYVVEATPLGTAGSIKHAQPYIDNEPFLVVSGDAVTDLDLTSLVQFHRQKGGVVTLALKHMANPRESGLVVMDWQDRIRQYKEKPIRGSVNSSLVNTGIYVVEPAVLNHMAPGRACDFSYDLFPHLLAQNEPLFGYLAGDYWRDMGTLAGYRQAVTDVLTGRVKYIELGHNYAGQVWTGRNVKIAANARLLGPIYLGHAVRIGRDVTIYGPAVVGDGTVVEPGARIERSIIGPNCFLEPSVELREAIVPRLSWIARSVVPDIVTMVSNKAPAVGDMFAGLWFRLEHYFKQRGA